MTTLTLPAADGALAPYTMAPPRALPRATPPFSRIAFSAAHVVADPLADIDPWLASAIDWDRTIAYRQYLCRSVSAWRKRWTRRSAAWGSIGRAASN